jgi:hypothetical protein
MWNLVGSLVMWMFGSVLMVAMSCVFAEIVAERTDLSRAALLVALAAAVQWCGIWLMVG